MATFLHFSLVPFLLAIAALLAASEAALFSLTSAQLEVIRTKLPAFHQRIKALLSEPQELLSTLVVSNECVNIALGTIVTGLCEYHFTAWDDKWILAASIGITASLLLFVSEILPKVLAFRVPIWVAGATVFPLSWFHVLVSPLRKLLVLVSQFILRKAKITTESHRAISEEEFRVLVEVGEQTGSLEKAERDLILNVFDFSDLTVASIMTPWERVFFLQESTPLEKVLEQVREKPFSRIPVLSKTGRVMGILYVKELTKFLLSGDESKVTLHRALSRPFVVPLQKKVHILFRDFQQKKMHLALVVDEYGKNLGVVTLDDVLNALFRLRGRAEGALG